MIVQTIKNIKKGEEICENYGPIFFHSPKADRQVKILYKACHFLSEAFTVFCIYKVFGTPELTHSDLVLDLSQFWVMTE